MEKIKNKIEMGLIKARCGLYNFVHKDNGDTNFISIALIIAIVVVLAGIVLSFARTGAEKAGEKVTNFIENAT